MKKTSIDEHGAPDLTLNTKIKYTEGESRDRLRGRNKTTLPTHRKKPKFRWI